MGPPATWDLPSAKWTVLIPTRGIRASGSRSSLMGLLSQIRSRMVRKQRKGKRKNRKKIRKKKQETYVRQSDSELWLAEDLFRERRVSGREGEVLRGHGTMVAFTTSDLMIPPRIRYVLFNPLEWTNYVIVYLSAFT